MVRGALVVAAVGCLGVVLGAAISGRPQGVPNDIVVTRLPEATTTTTSTTSPPPRRSERIVTTTSAPSRILATPPIVTTTARQVATTTAVPADVPSATPATSPPAATLAPESGLRLVVANATDAPGLAARTLAELRTMGYSDSVPTDAVTPRLDTIIVHVHGRAGEAMRLATQAGVDPAKVRPRQSEPLTSGLDDADLWLLLGADRS
jgi:hypothetical protein